MNDENVAELADPLYSDESLEHYRTGDSPYLYPNVDWQDLMYKKPSLMQQYKVDVQGGTEKVKKFESFGYTAQGGL